MKVVRLALFATGAFAILLVVACGGSGSSGGTGQRITDPAKVPTSTPISGGQVYKIQGEGAVLIGGGAVGSTTATTARTYTVVANDTCAGIASKNNISLDDLLRANRAIDQGCANLRVGDVLRLPAPPTPAGGSGPIVGGPGTPKPGTSKNYKIVAGDTCDAIAKNQGIEVAKLQAANPAVDCSKLAIGATITIPG